MNNTYINSRAKNTCQDNFSTNFVESGWRGLVDALAGDLTEAKTENCELARGRFYVRFWKMSLVAAKSVMKGYGWRGDLERDGQDVAAANVEILLGQEERGAGVFDDQARNDEQLRGYLSRTIWLGCKQRISRTMRKQMVSLEALVEDGYDLDVLRDQCVSDPVLRMDLERAIEDLQKDERGHYRKLPAGVTPLDCVMDAGIGRAVLKGAKMRTIQRYVKQIREDVARKVGIDLEARRKAAQRGVEKRRLARSKVAPGIATGF